MAEDLSYLTLRSEDVEDMLDVSNATVLRLFASGDLKAMKVRGTWRTRKEWVHEYKQEQFDKLQAK